MDDDAVVSKSDGFNHVLIGFLAADIWLCIPCFCRQKFLVYSFDKAFEKVDAVLFLLSRAVGVAI